MNPTDPTNLHQFYYDQLQNELAKLYPEETPIDIDPIIEQIKILEQFSPASNRFYCLFSQVKFCPIYISQNIETGFGYSPELIYQEGLSFFFKIVYWKQLPMAVRVHKWSNCFQQMVGKQVPMVNRQVFFSGLKLKDYWGKWRILSINQKIISAQGHKPILSFMEIEDIGPLFKTDHFWGRFTANHKQQLYTRFFTAKGSKKEYEDLLSAREMEIFQLVVSGKSNIEISEHLGISKNTVERHRKNMIARAGVKNMTALIQIGRLSGIL